MINKLLSFFGSIKIFLGIAFAFIAIFFIGLANGISRGKSNERNSQLKKDNEDSKGLINELQKINSGNTDSVSSSRDEWLQSNSEWYNDE